MAKMSQYYSMFYSFCWETYLGANTQGRVESLVGGGVHYTPLPYLAISRILARLNLSAEDILVDLGCGKGRVLCLACRRHVRRVVGIEANGKLLEVASRNLRRVPRKRSEIELRHMLAQEYDFKDANVIVMFNPFDEASMAQVFAIVDKAYRQNPRIFKVAYANCVHEKPLEKLGWLRRVDEWPPSYVPGFSRAISFWTSM